MQKTKFFVVTGNADSAVVEEFDEQKDAENFVRRAKFQTENINGQQKTHFQAREFSFDARDG